MAKLGERYDAPVMADVWRSVLGLSVTDLQTRVFFGATCRFFKKLADEPAPSVLVSTPKQASSGLVAFLLLPMWRETLREVIVECAACTYVAHRAFGWAFECLAVVHGPLRVRLACSVNGHMMPTIARILSAACVSEVIVDGRLDVEPWMSTPCTNAVLSDARLLLGAAFYARSNVDLMVAPAVASLSVQPLTKLQLDIIDSYGVFPDSTFSLLARVRAPFVAVSWSSLYDMPRAGVALASNPTLRALRVSFLPYCESAGLRSLFCRPLVLEGGLKIVAPAPPDADVSSDLANALARVVRVGGALSLDFRGVALSAGALEAVSRLVRASPTLTNFWFGCGEVEKSTRATAATERNAASGLRAWCWPLAPWPPPGWPWRPWGGSARTGRW